MLILWIRKVKTAEPSRPQKDDKNSLQKHNEDMKKFRLSHPAIEAASSKDKDIITANGDVLATVQKVKLTKHAQN